MDAPSHHHHPLHKPNSPLPFKNFLFWIVDSQKVAKIDHRRDLFLTDISYITVQLPFLFWLKKLTVALCAWQIDPMSINKWPDKHIAVYSGDGIVHSNEKARTEPCNNMEKLGDMLCERSCTWKSSRAGRTKSTAMEVKVVVNSIGVNTDKEGPQGGAPEDYKGPCLALVGGCPGIHISTILSVHFTVYKLNFNFKIKILIKIK